LKGARGFLVCHASPEYLRFLGGFFWNDTISSNDQTKGKIKQVRVVFRRIFLHFCNGVVGFLFDFVFLFRLLGFLD